MQAIPFWLRWAAVLPGAVLAMFVATIPVHLGVMLLQWNLSDAQSISDFVPIRGTPYENIERLGYAFCSPLVFVYCAGRIAPAFHLRIAAILVLLWAVLLGVLWTMAMFRVRVGNTVYSSPGGWPYALIAVALGLTGAVTGLYILYRWERRHRTGNVTGP